MELTFGVTEVLIAVLATIVVTITVFFKWSFNYWKSRGIEEIPNPSIPFGHISNMMRQKQSIFNIMQSMYQSLRSRNLRHGGSYFFSKPIWIPVELELIRSILIKDFAHFVNRGIYVNEKIDPLSGNLFFLEDEKWKHTRAALTHTFTSGKIKMMFQLMLKSAENLIKVVDSFASNREALDIKDYVERFTMDLIASSAFGLDIDTFNNPDEEFRKYGKRSFEDTGYEALKTLLAFLAPRKWLTAVNFKLFKTDVEKFFFQTLKETVEYREEHNIVRKDFLQLLIQLKNTGRILDLGDDDNESETSSKDRTLLKLSMNELSAEAVIFFLAGFETSSTTTTFVFFELSLNQDIQDKVRAEIRDVLEKHNGQLTYEACTEMNYMDQVIKETLRKYPPVSMLTRVCNKDYPVPGSEVVIEKDTMVMIPIAGLHYDSEIYPEPEKFDPERFSENKKFIPNNAFLTFGEGPRLCIGMRLGMVQVKVALATVLKDHKVTLNREKTTYPVEFEPKYQITTVKGGVWLNVSKVD